MVQMIVNGVGRCSVRKLRHRSDEAKSLLLLYHERWPAIKADNGEMIERLQLISKSK